MDTKVEVTVRSYHDGYRTSRVDGITASCSYCEETAVKNLAGKLFAHRHWRATRLEEFPLGTNGNIVGKWEIVEE